MRKSGALLVVVSLVLVAPPPSHALQGVGEASWADNAMNGSGTFVKEESCVVATDLAPYNYKCKFTAIADNRLSASPQRGKCSEVLATIGPRRIDGPCRAEFAIIGMRVHRVTSSGSNPVCNGASVDQDTGGVEPEPLRGSFEFENSDGLVRPVQVDVTITNNVLKFAGSVVRIGTEEILDEVKGSFPIRCRNSTGSGFAGNYNYVS